MKTLFLVIRVTINEDRNIKSGVSGEITLKQEGAIGDLKITGSVKGLQKYHNTNSSNSSNEHAFYIHENPVVDMDCTTAGSHFNPTNKTHGKPGSPTGNYMIQIYGHK